MDLGAHGERAGNGAGLEEGNKMKERCRKGAKGGKDAIRWRRWTVEEEGGFTDGTPEEEIMVGDLDEDKKWRTLVHT